MRTIFIKNHNFEAQRFIRTPCRPFWKIFVLQLRVETKTQKMYFKILSIFVLNLLFSMPTYRQVRVDAQTFWGRMWQKRFSEDRLRCLQSAACDFPIVFGGVCGNRNLWISFRMPSTAEAHCTNDRDERRPPYAVRRNTKKTYRDYEIVRMEGQFMSKLPPRSS